MSPKTSRIGKQRYLEIAEGLFTERGYKSVSIRDIAQACGVTNAALYYHFKNKESLFAEVLENHAGRLSDHMRQAAAGETDIREQVVAMLTEYATLAAHRRSPMFTLRHKSSGLDREHARQQHARLIGAILTPIEAALNQAVESGELRPLPEEYSAASLLLGMMHGMFQHRRMCQHGGVTPEDVRIIVDIFWNGMEA